MTTNLSARLEVLIVFPASAVQQHVKDSSTNRSVTFLLSSSYSTGIGDWEALVWIFIIHFTALEFCGPPFFPRFAAQCISEMAGTSGIIKMYSFNRVFWAFDLLRARGRAVDERIMGLLHQRRRKCEIQLLKSTIKHKDSDALMGLV
jgi:hypothetical protein